MRKGEGHRRPSQNMRVLLRGGRRVCVTYTMWLNTKQYYKLKVMTKRLEHNLPNINYSLSPRGASTLDQLLPHPLQCTRTDSTANGAGRRWRGQAEQCSAAGPTGCRPPSLVRLSINQRAAARRHQCDFHLRMDDLHWELNAGRALCLTGPSPFHSAPLRSC